jgi:hypothetical protein
VNVARILARRLFRAAAPLERTGIAIAFGGSIKQGLIIVDGATRSEHLAVRTDVDAIALIPPEVGPREGAVLAPRLVDEGDMRCDLLLLDAGP